MCIVCNTVKIKDFLYYVAPLVNAVKYWDIQQSAIFAMDWFLVMSGNSFLIIPIKGVMDAFLKCYMDLVYKL